MPSPIMMFNHARDKNLRFEHAHCNHKDLIKFRAGHDLMAVDNAG